MASGTLSDTVSVEDFNKISQKAGSSLLVVHFWADWAAQCGMMNDVMLELAKQFMQAYFVKVEAEMVPELSEQYGITAVPTFIFLKNNQQVDRLDGANAPELTKKVEHHCNSLASPPPPPPSSATSSQSKSEDLNSRLKKLLNSAPCMLFMKGVAQEPRCGFSKKMVAILNQHGAQYTTFNILADEEVRQGLKEYSNWPTYPQLYINGELVGGLDIVKEMEESGELDSMLPKAVNLQDRLKSLVGRAPVMVFVKGDRTEPRCGFSKTMVSLLNHTGVKYETFDILQDEEVRQELKKFSNWPTYPQLYVKGELIGGLDIVKELKETGELENVLTDS